jgi:hypothetical protein
MAGTLIYTKHKLQFLKLNLAQGSYNTEILFKFEICGDIMIMVLKVMQFSQVDQVPHFHGRYILPWKLDSSEMLVLICHSIWNFKIEVLFCPPFSSHEPITCFNCCLTLISKYRFLTFKNILVHCQLKKNQSLIKNVGFKKYGFYRTKLAASREQFLWQDVISNNYMTVCDFSLARILPIHILLYMKSSTVTEWNLGWVPKG